MTRRLLALLPGLVVRGADYRQTSRLFIKALAVIYLIAFASLAVQIDGLAGPDGILPLDRALAEAHAARGPAAWWQIPTLFWLDAGAVTLELAAWTGCVLALVLLAGRLVRTALVLLFLLYLSLVHAGQLFMSFQWDYLLLEAGFLAIFLPTGSGLVVWLMRWLLFRLRFLSGASKLLSGDPTWSGFTALNHYFEVQPLPHALSWYAHQLPDWTLKAGVGLTLFAELVVPLLMFLPRGPRFFAAWVTIGVQVLIILTSNHNFVNFLTIALCLFLFDDRALGRAAAWVQRPAVAAAPGAAARLLMPGLFAMILALSAARMWGFFGGGPLPAPAAAAVEALGPWHLVNNYHVFPTMKTERIELTIEGSPDGETWRTYRFKYKPGDPARRPPFVLPHQPRLDWLIWFVPMSHPMFVDWHHSLLRGLLRGSPAVTDLLAADPFAGDAPRLVRTTAWRYRFTTPAERAATGNWWHRERLGPFYPLPVLSRRDLEAWP